MAESPLRELQAAHVHFLGLVQALRPEIHRYCARMTGSVTDGEDVVQEVLAHAYYELSQLNELPALRAWLFRIAHNRSVNFIAARSRRREGAPIDDAADAPSDAPPVDEVLMRGEAMSCALGHFLGLPPVQRACVILKDVLDATLEDIASTLEITVPAVKAALHRGRTRLAELRAEAQALASPPAHSSELLRYVDLFNERDWSGVRALLAEDVRLELVSRERRRGAQVGLYFTNYASIDGWRLTAAWLDGDEVIAVHRNPSDPRPAYVIQLTVSQGLVTSIRDYRYVPYLLADSTIEL
jgi:RNA polymerase sigma-70 factor (ECF subfamily)